MLIRFLLILHYILGLDLGFTLYSTVEFELQISFRRFNLFISSVIANFVTLNKKQTHNAEKINRRSYKQAD